MNIFKFIKDFITGKPEPTREYTLLDDVKIVIMEYNELQKKHGLVYPNRKHIKVNGFYDNSNRTVYVHYWGGKDINGNMLPSMEVLGHEIWHLKELGGNWHKCV